MVGEVEPSKYPENIPNEVRLNFAIPYCPRTKPSNDDKRWRDITGSSQLYPLTIFADSCGTKMTLRYRIILTPEARFSDLNVSRISTDHFTFHVKKLTELKLIEKTEENSYRLTVIGKEFANRFDVDTENVVLERQAKIGVLIGCVRGEGKDREYLIQQRLKQPYFGYYGFMTGKVKLGETVYETAERELQEEMGLAADLKLVGVRHKMDYDKDRRLLEDKYFYVFRGENP